MTTTKIIKVYSRLALAAVGALLVLSPALLHAQGSARVQIAHNSGDPDASIVDVIITGPGGFPVISTIEDVEYLTATAYDTYTWLSGSSTTVNIYVSPPGGGVPGAVYSTTVTLFDEDTLVAIAAGTVGLDFEIFLTDGIEDAAANEFLVKFFHGSSDAPTVDIRVMDGPRPGASLVGGGFSFGEFSSNYFSLEEDIAVEFSDAGTNLGRLYVPTLDLVGTTGLVVASGYWAPLPGEPSFSFYEIPNTGGDFIEVEGAATFQFIHNAPDPDLDSVDVYDGLSGELLLEDFKFREATPFLHFPVDQTLGIAPGNSTGFGQVIETFNVPEDSLNNYYVVAQGVLTPADFAPNPNGISTDFAIGVIPAERVVADAPGEVDLLLHHGAPDGIAVRLNSFDGVLEDSVKFMEVSADYIELPAEDYLLLLQNARTASPPLVNDATFVPSGSTMPNNLLGVTAPLADIPDSTVFVFASGFFTPALNQNGRPFGVFAALNDGTVLQLPPGALMQVIHGATDPLLDTVDVYLDDVRVGDDFLYSGISGALASPYMWVNSLLPIDLGFAPATSTSSAQAIHTETFTLNPGVPVVAVASGVLDPADFVANPSGNPTAFNVYTFAPAQLRSPNDSLRALLFHGVTDAPGVDLEEDIQGLGLVATDLRYSEFNTNYISINDTLYGLDVLPTGTTTPIKRYSANLNLLTGRAAVLLVLGFMDTTANNASSIYRFQLFGCLANGLIVALTEVAVVGLDDDFGKLAQNFVAYPNPAQDRMQLAFDLTASQAVSANLLDLNGRVVRAYSFGKLPSGQQNLEVAFDGLPNGIYILNTQVGNSRGAAKVLIQR